VAFPAVVHYNIQDADLTDVDTASAPGPVISIILQHCTLADGLLVEVQNGMGMMGGLAHLAYWLNDAKCVCVCGGGGG
jgi:hypothetical protein